MKLKTYQSQNQSTSPQIRDLARRTFSPFTGLLQEIGYLKRSSHDAALITVGGELTGVHHVLGRPDPGKGGYHIGGVGYFHDEALIKTIAESLERYSQLFSEIKVKNELPRQFLSYREMSKLYKNLLPEVFLKPFDQTALSKNSFPFDSYDPDKPITWVEVTILNQKNTLWIPAQFLFLGYTCRRPEEPWLFPSVTTGTAAHITKEKAIINAISELIQIDSAMGHWYTDHQAKKIVLDDRVAVFRSFLEKVLRSNQIPAPVFYSLENKDLPGFNIACIWHRSPSAIPRFAVGLGSDFSLEKALYKAFLEGYGVVGLARLNLYKKMNTPMNEKNKEIYDLDSNVALYAEGKNAEFFQSKFGDQSSISTSQLPPNWVMKDDAKMVEFLANSFAQAGKDLVYTDLTTKEAKELGFYIARLYSPQVLSLSLPSCAPSLHPRFKEYSNVLYDFPHPYP